MKFRVGPKGRLPRAGAVAALAAALALPGALLVAGCGKVESTTGADGTIDESAIVLNVSAGAVRVGPGNSTTLNIRATDRNGYLVPDGTTVTMSQEPTLGVISPGTVSTVGGLATATFTAGSQVGTTRVRASYGRTSSDPLEIEIVEGGGGGGGGGGTDVIDLTTVIWTDANPSDYPVTAQLRGVSFRLPNVCWEHAEWPQSWGFLQRVNASQSVFAKVNGQWYSGAWESLTPAYSGTGGCRVLECIVKHEPHGPFCQVEDDPFWGWYPKSGEEIGFMMSSFIRNHQVPRGDKGRSPVVMARWP